LIPLLDTLETKKEYHSYVNIVCTICEEKNDPFKKHLNLVERIQTLFE